MVKFLDIETEAKLINYVRSELTYKYNQDIKVCDKEIVTGVTGEETIEEALIIQFFPEDANVEWVENKIEADIHRYCYENDLKIHLSPVIEKDVWLGKIRYGLVYTE